MWSRFSKKRRQGLYPETGCSKYDRRLPIVYKKGQTGVLKKERVFPLTREGETFSSLLGVDMGRKEDENQLKLLEIEDSLDLPHSKKRLIMKKAGTFSRPVSGQLFDNCIGLITIEELAVIFGLAPQTLRNWIALGKIPHVKIGRKHFFQKRSVQEWLNRKEEPQWQ